MLLLGEGAGEAEGGNCRVRWGYSNLDGDADADPEGDWLGLDEVGETGG